MLAEGKDVAELQRELRPRLRAVLSAGRGAGSTRTGLTSWDFGSLPEVFTDGHGAGLPGAGRRGRHG